MKDSKALEEVWEWKDVLYEETKNMNKEELIKYFRENTEEFLNDMGYEKVMGDDGLYKLEYVNKLSKSSK